MKKIYLEVKVVANNEVYKLEQSSTWRLIVSDYIAKVRNSRKVCYKE